MALALYRKYRPRTFAEVIGQEHVTEPLSQALRSGRLNHAYLFSGPRGCGKTSSARILARSLNCEQGPTPEPCGVCTSCKSLANDGAGSIDVIEIDAASHGGVDDARELREKAFFAPANSRYKIYVIDEAHMVSSAGFNALLKLVEEPPEYVKFIFATTEPEKVLGTIKSRTHHYPFRLIPPSVLRPYLEQLCEAEGVKVEPAVFPLVVRAGGGSARDTLSVLDQLIAGAGEEGVTYARAVSLLGVTDSALIDDMIDSLAAADGASAFAAIDRVAEAGHDPRRFATDLLERLRDLIVMQQVPDAAAKGLIDGPADEIERMTTQAGRFGTATLSRAADIVHNGLVEMRGTTGPRLLLELITARMLLPGADDSTSALLQRLERMERHLAAGGGTPQNPPAVRSQPAPVSLGASGSHPAAEASVPAGPGPESGLDPRAAARQAAARSSGGGQAAARQAAAQAGAPAQGRRPAAAQAAGAPVSPAAPAVQPGAAQAEPARPGHSPSGPAQAGPSPAAPSQAGASQAGPAQGGTAQGGPAQTGSVQGSPAQTGPAQGSHAESGPAQSGSMQGGPVQAPAGQAAPAASPAAVVDEPAASPDGVDVAELRSRWWPEAHAYVNARNKRAGAVLRDATVRTVEGDTLVLSFRLPNHIDLFAGTPGGMDLVREAFYELLGVRWQVRCVPAGPAGEPDAPTGRGGRAPAQRQSTGQSQPGHPTPPSAPTRSLSESDARSGPSPGPSPASTTAAEDAGWPTPAAIPSTPPPTADRPGAESPHPAPGGPHPSRTDTAPASAEAGTAVTDDGRPTPAQPGIDSARRDSHPVRPGTSPAADDGWPAPAQPGSTPAQPEPAGGPNPAHSGSAGEQTGDDGWPAPAAPGSGGVGDDGDWPEPVRPGTVASTVDDSGWPEPVTAGGGAASDEGWPEPVQAGGPAATSPERSGGPAPVAADGVPRRATAGGLAAARAAAAASRGKQAANGGGQRGAAEARPGAAENPAATVPAGTPVSAGSGPAVATGGGAWDDFPADEEPPYDPEYDGPAPPDNGVAGRGGFSARTSARPAAAGSGPASPGNGFSSAGGAPAPPADGGPGPAGGSFSFPASAGGGPSAAASSGAVSGGAASGPAASGGAVFPVPSAAAVAGASASGVSTSAATAPAGRAAGPGSPNPAIASAKAAASRAAANAAAAAQGRGGAAKQPAAATAEAPRPTQGRAAAAVAAANAAAAAAAAAQASQPAETSAKEFEGFDPGDEPLDEVIDEQAARQSSEEQAFLLLKQAFGAEKITEM
ncbi:DNA polymerase III subunit gamma and tau [Catenuloplanes indicus]|uniref:DNA polymerase III subunit gamma/tau n=1 Tax=Catenuloplanes indicus TaxID=137267 RepID=A0AAE4AXX5_9ACTN|nr:DNA polymerase III subunit gamma and tau [Catenuloplanes indicus]MDQ0367530.1 DNA polymerase-3 subunit gamma/tau [Catenuloplanes indicus]